MDSDTENHATKVEYSSSDDECLSTVKRKAESNLAENEKKCKYEDDSDDSSIMAGVLVTVEVEEMDESPLDFRSKSEKRKKKKKKKSMSPPSKKEPKVFRCTVCEATFDNKPDLKTHALEHQVKTRHKCEECGRYFKKAFSLRMHMKVHTVKIQECALCGLIFNTRISLGRHMMSHERTVPCKHCDAKFHFQAQLEGHIQYAHSKHKPRSKRLRHARNQNATNPTSDNEMECSERKNTNEIKNEDEGSQSYSYNERDESTNGDNNYEVCQKRDDLSESTQCAIVSKMHKGRSIADVCQLYNLTPEVANEIWEDRERFSKQEKIAKKGIRYMNSVLDARILDWFQTQKANDVQVSGKMVQDTAEAFAKESGFVAFNGSRKWLDRFKAKYNITLRGTPSKRDYHNQNSKWKDHFLKDQWRDARLGYPDEDIYTADEFGFFYNPSKGRIKKLAGKKYIQGYVKDRLAVFLCANMPGTDKRKLLVCGTDDPLMHSHRNPDTLPVTYIRHSQAHFTTQMFEEYVKYWNRELQMKNRKAILILDRATIHSKLQLSHLKLVFVPWKATNGLIPMKTGVWAKFRDEFRRLMIVEKAMNVLRGVDRNITCLEALNMLEKSWDRISPDVITKSFLDTGYDVTVPDERPIERPKVYDNDEEILCNMLKDYDVESYYANMEHLDNYLTVDEELVTGQGTNGSVFGGNHKVIDPKTTEKEKEDLLPISTDKPESEEKELLVKKSRALQDLDIVRKYLQSNETNFDTFSCFMEVEKFAMQTIL